MVIGAIAAGVGAVGAISGGNRAKRAANARAKQARYQAAYTRDQTAAAMIRQNKESRRVLGAMRAAYGAAGVTVEGSPLDVLAESAANAELDRLTIKYSGELKAKGFDTDAKMSEAEASAIGSASMFKAAGAILGGFA